MAIATLTIDLNARLARIEQDLNKVAQSAERSARRMQTAFAGVNRIFGALGAGLTVGAFAGFIKGSIDAADAVFDLQKRTGLLPDEMLVLQGAAARTGVSMEDVSGTISKLPKRLNEAAKGTGDAAAAFQALGIRVTTGSGGLKGVGQILDEIGAKFQGFEDGTDKAAIAVAALGRGGDRLIGLAESLAEVRERFEQLGITIDQQTLDRADAFNDTMRDVGDVLRNVGTRISAALLPTLQRLADVLVDATKDTRSFAEFADILSTALQGLVTAGLIVQTVFSVLGRTIAGTIGVLQRVLSFDFSGALSIAGETIQDIASTTAINVGRIRKIWDDAAKGPEAFGRAVARTRTAAPRLPDLEAAKKAADALLKLEDARAKNELELVKLLGEQRLKVLERFYKEGLIGEREYWDARAGIQSEALAAETAALDRAITQREAALSKAPKGSAEALDQQRELEELITKRTKLEREAGFASVTNFLDSQKAAEDYADTIRRLDADLAEFAGRSADAARIRFDQQNREIERRFASNRDRGGLQRVQDLRQAVIAQAGFNDEREKGQEILDRLAIQEERIQNSRRTGAITELDSLKRTSIARRASFAELQAIADSLEALAEESGSKRLALDAERFRAKLEELAATSDLVRDKFSSIFQDAFADFFEKVAAGTASIKDAFNSMVNSIVASVSRIAAENLAQKIFGSLLGDGKGGAGGNAADLLGSLFQKLFGFQHGGSFLVGGAGGPDSQPVGFLATPGERVTITPRGSAGGSVVVNVNFSGGTPPDRRTSQQFAAEVGRHVSRATRRNT